jgi:hypothetical protein
MTKLSASWDQQGTVKASVALSSGSRVQRRRFTLLTGALLTALAHQWLVRDPEPLVSGRSGGRVPVALADQLPEMIATLRAMDDTAGGGTVLSLEQEASVGLPSSSTKYPTTSTPTKSCMSRWLSLAN